MTSFLDSKTLQEDIEFIVKVHKMTYFEAMLLYLHDNSIDPEEIVPIISPNLKAKIYADAMCDGLLKKEESLDC